MPYRRFPRTPSSRSTWWARAKGRSERSHEEASPVTTRDSPQLPPLYELVSLGRVDSVLEEGCRRALGGAEEGTLIWAQEQTAARSRLGHAWESPAGNLYCALVIRPDYPRAAADQLVHVMTIAAGEAMAGLISPMVALRYRWPNHILLDDLRAAQIMVVAPNSDMDPYEWLVLSLVANIEHHPENPEPEHYSSIHASGAFDVTVVQMLEAFSRYFLLWINRWADEGFAPVATAWKQRGHGIGDSLSTHLGEDVVAGTFCDLDGDGRLVLEVDNGSRRTVSIAESFSLGPGRAAVV